jgi:hypothetical protein
LRRPARRWSPVRRLRRTPGCCTAAWAAVDRATLCRRPQDRGGSRTRRWESTHRDGQNEASGAHAPVGNGYDGGKHRRRSPPISADRPPTTIAVGGRRGNEAARAEAMKRARAQDCCIPPPNRRRRAVRDPGRWVLNLRWRGCVTPAGRRLAPIVPTIPGR